MEMNCLMGLLLHQPQSSLFGYIFSNSLQGHTESFWMTQVLAK